MKELIVMLESPTGFHLEASYSIGTAAVSAYVKQMGHDIICLNLNSNKDTEISCAKRIYNFVKVETPDVVAVGGLVTDWKRIKEVCDMAKAAKPDITVIIGGGFVDYSPDEAMALIGVADYGVIGEGEVTLHELLTALENNQPIEDVDGLIYRESLCGLVKTKKRDVVKDLDSLPFLDYEGFGLFDEIDETKSFAMISSRSCPFACTYCTHSGGGRYRQRSLDYIFEEIDYVIKQVPDVKILSICDELFAANKDRFERFIDRIARYKLEWLLPMRADSIKDQKVFMNACNAGCKEIQVGLEAGCDSILKSMRKGISTAMLREFYRNASFSDISILSTLIFGDVAETTETVEKSLAFAKEIQEINAKAQIYVAPISLYPGSPLYDDAKMNGKISDTIKHILDGIPFVNVSQMADEEYNFLIKRIVPGMTTCHHIRTAIGRQKLIDYQRRINLDRFESSYTYLHIADIDKIKHIYYLSYTCPKCNEIFYKVADSVTYGLDFEYSVYCPVCRLEHQIDNKIHAAMILDESFFETIKTYLKRLLEFGNVGITGMGIFFARYRLEFKRIFDELELLSEHRFIFSDGSPDIADKSMAIERKIYNTNSILNKVKNIVVPSAYSPPIRERVHSKFSQIGVFGLFELPFLDKNCDANFQ